MMTVEESFRPPLAGPAYVCFWHKADIATVAMNVRFRVNSGHRLALIRCLLLTQSGHQQLMIAACKVTSNPMPLVANPCCNSSRSA
jgi:hypothetical protein